MRITRLPASLFAVLCLLLLQAFPVMGAQGPAGDIPVLDSPGLVKLVQEEGKNKVTVLSIFASWCPPCKVEMPMLAEIRGGIPPEDLLLVGLSVDESMKDLKGFIKDMGINFPVYSGTQELFLALGIGPIPHTFVFNRKGELVESFVGLMPEPQFKLMLARLLDEPGV